MKKKKSIHIKEVDAAIFDLDGVVTNTATVHARAWKQMFDNFLLERDESQEEFDPLLDYEKYIDGKPRYDGVQSFLEARNIQLPKGAPEDAASKETICGLGNRKNEIFQQLLETKGFEVYADAVNKIKAWKANGIKTAIVSSSKNCKKVLELAGIAHLFNERVDGVVSEELKLQGKPAPDIFLEAANRLRIAPKRIVVFEDAIAGVEAGAQGHFGCVVGVERKNRMELLKAHGADEIITSFDQISIYTEKLARQLPLQKIPSALAHYQEIKNLFTSRTPALFLGYEGLLSATENNTTTPAERRKTLQTLAKYCTLVIVSEHAPHFVKKEFNLNKIYYAGSYGLQIDGPGIHYSVGEEVIPQLNQAEEAVRKQLDATQLIKEKLLLAYPLNNGHTEKIKALFQQQAEKHSRLRVEEHPTEIILRPNIDWNEGNAIAYLLEKLDLDDSDILPVFLGTSAAAEEGFRKLHAHGIGIKVGTSTARSYARYRLADVSEATQLLYQLTEIVSKEPAFNWKIVYDDYKPKEEALREALCTLGNGYFASRGAAEESRDDGLHYPGTYLAGGYNRAESTVAGKLIENEDLVNFPNWLILSFSIDGGPWFSTDEVELHDYQQLLNLKEGVLERRMHFSDNQQRETELITRRFVSQKNSHMAGIEWRLEPKNWSGKVAIRTALDGRVTNNGVKRYQALNGKHLTICQMGKEGEQGIYLLAKTRQSDIYMAVAARTLVFQDNRALAASRETKQQEEYIEQIIRFSVEKLKPLHIEKIVAVFSSKDNAIASPVLEAKKSICVAGRFNELLARHRQGWKELWSRFDIEIDGSLHEQMILRLHIFHLLQTISLKSIRLDVGVPARGWHGEAYRGHIFWDEIFIFPFINLRVPELTRALLKYRYRRLPEARRNAEACGFRGAMFPWQSGSNGREESQQIHLNPKSGQWLPDDTYIQRHISADIVFNIMKYYEATKDREFINYYGAEVVLDIANFFSSLARWSEQKQRFEITHIAGPDEYHTHYANSDKPGINNNAYTNIMAAWVLQTALSVLEELIPSRKNELLLNLDISDEDLLRWKKVGSEMFVPFIDAYVINQFEGYEQLEELNWDKYQQEHGDYLRLDRILQAEGDDVNRYKASKQADVLMLFYLFSNDELKAIFQQLNYPFHESMIQKNIAYYGKRTAHGSTLSQLVHSWVTARCDRSRSWHSFTKALISDFKDVQGGTTPEGIHLGAMAGTVDLLQRCYAGIATYQDILWINPQLPENLRQISLRINYRSKWIRIHVNHKKLQLKIEEGWGDKITVGFNNKTYAMQVGDAKTFHLPPPPESAKQTTTHHANV